MTKTFDCGHTSVRVGGCTPILIYTYCCIYLYCNHLACVRLGVNIVLCSNLSKHIIIGNANKTYISLHPVLSSLLYFQVHFMFYSSFT